jgi:hypothetical protein
MSQSPQQFQTDVAKLSLLANRDVGTILQNVMGASPESIRDLLIQVMPDVLAPYTSASGALAATWYEDLRRDTLGGTFMARPADMVYGRSKGLIKWAAGALFDGSNETFQERMRGGIQRMVADVARWTVDENAQRDVATVGWSRIAEPGACQFCKMLAGRGPVYRSKAAAGVTLGRGSNATGFDASGKRRGGIGGGIKSRGNQAVGDGFHDNCHCTTKPTFYRLEARRDERSGLLGRVLAPIS